MRFPEREAEPAVEDRGSAERFMPFLLSALPFLFYGAFTLTESGSFWALEHLRGKGGLLALLFLIWIAINIGYWRGVRLPALRHPLSNGPLFHPLSLLILSILFALFMYEFRMRLYLPAPQGNGDSIHLIEHVTVFSELYGYLDSFDEILELYARSKAYLLLSHYGFDAMDAYAITGCALGGIYFFIASFAATRRFTGRLLPFTAIGFLTPPLALYAGYVENYTFASLFLFAILILSYRILSEERTPYAGGNPFTDEPGIIFVAILAAIGAMFHIVIGIAGPALVYLVYARSADRRSFVKLAAAASIPALLIMGTTWLYFLLLIDHPIQAGESFLMRPPFLRPGQLLTAEHIINELNLYLLASPSLAFIILYAVAMMGIERSGGDQTERRQIEGAEGLTFIAHTQNESTMGLPGKRGLTRNRPLLFLLIASGAYQFEQFIHNPMLGFPADWDLFTLINIPMNLALFVWITNRFDRKRLFPIVSAALAVNLFVTASWIGRNADPGGRSEDYRRLSDYVIRGSLDLLRNDADLASLPSNRQKTYARIVLFSTKAQLKIDRIAEESTNAARRERVAKMGRTLASLVNELRSISALPDDDYKKRLPPLWRELTRINIELTALPEPEPYFNASSEEKSH